ncbi:MAG: PEP-CTERM sorting domain-containing protein [Bryobacteraceae bacterium]
MVHKWLTGCFLIVALAFALPSPAAIIVPATSNIFASGQGSAPSGTLPVLYSLDPLAVAVQFPSISGTVYFGANPPYPGNSGDGVSFGSWQGTNMNPYPNSGLSGVRFDGRQFFLVGVFLGPGTPSGSGPATINYDSSSVLGPTFSPLLGQIFFIGDGQGTGGTQTFNIPVGATRLFLGFADGAPEFGNVPLGTPTNPGAYLDNWGSLTVNIEEALIPEPTTFLLMGLGLAGLGLIRRKSSV